MELWIRSQDRKKLIQTKYIAIAEKSNAFELYTFNDGLYNQLGIYKTEERAIEVLDLICQHQDKSHRIAYIKQQNDYVTRKIGISEIFQMPEE